MRIRRDSRVTFGDMTSSFRPSFATPLASNDEITTRRRNTRRSSGQESDDDRTPTDDRTPLLQPSSNGPSPSALGRDYGISRTASKGASSAYRRRSPSANSTRSAGRRPPMRHNSGSLMPPGLGYDVNNPPSVPPSPTFMPQEGPDDVLATDALSPEVGPEGRSGGSRAGAGDVLIDIDDNAAAGQFRWPSPSLAARMPMPGVEGDVCFPVEGLSELGEEDFLGAPGVPAPDSQEPWRRKRTRRWPDLSVLEEWSREERAERHEEIRAKKISEPVLVGGRLRANLKQAWHREEEDAPYRFTYFNEEFPSTIHSQTISELLQPGQTFRELFVPDPPELGSESSEEEEELSSQGVSGAHVPVGAGKNEAGSSRNGTREPSIQTDARASEHTSPRTQSTTHSPPNEKAATPAPKPKRYGARPTFWLDVLSPTETEMRVIQRAFGIHALTAEDILLQEAREKVELFPNYYFVNYRTFEQDASSDDYLEPVDMYVVVFREGVISFHFSLCPHPANVRRRIRQLKDYRVPNADWISYAVIDDVTDAFAPLIANVEKEVDDIDDAILQMHTVHAAGGASSSSGRNEPDGLGLGASLRSMTGGFRGGGGGAAAADDEKRSVKTDAPASDSGADMLLRVGRGRKKVMGLLRLLGNKADVIKGFAKRCNEQWEIAPRSDIGLYLGDIQDHIVTMTSNLGHYETYVYLSLNRKLTWLPLRIRIHYTRVMTLRGNDSPLTVVDAGSSHARTPITSRRSTSA